MNLRGKFTTDADGRIAFRSIKPAGYPIPIDGPTGDLLRAQGRHNMRPAHLHFLVQGGLQDADLADLCAGRQVHRQRRAVRRDAPPDRQLRAARERARAGAPDVKGPWYSLDYTFTMEPGGTKLPKPPITGKAKGERPKIPHLA